MLYLSRLLHRGVCGHADRRVGDLVSTVSSPGHGRARPRGTGAAVNRGVSRRVAVSGVASWSWSSGPAVSGVDCSAWPMDSMARRCSAEPDVGVDVGGGVDLGVAEQVLDRHQVHALFQQQCGTGVAQVVESDVAHVGEFADESGGCGAPRPGPAARRAVGEHEPGFAPPVAGLAPVDVLAPVVALERGDAFAGKDDTPGGAVGLDRLERGAAFGAGQGAPHVQVPGVEVDVVPAVGRAVRLARSPVRRASSNRARGGGRRRRAGSGGPRRR